ncbi:unnamed protein product [Rotaria socialis]
MTALVRQKIILITQWVFLGSTTKTTTASSGTGATSKPVQSPLPPGPRPSPTPHNKIKEENESCLISQPS